MISHYPIVKDKITTFITFNSKKVATFSECNPKKLLFFWNCNINECINLLEQTYVIFHLGSFSRNLRNELKQSKKYYFFDNGIRNALIANFNQPELRQDIGALWENFIIAERQKHILHKQLWVNQYYWRTKEQQEIDYIEESNGKLYAFEFKWNPQAKVKFPASFAKAYSESEFKAINRENFEEFII